MRTLVLHPIHGGRSERDADDALAEAVSLAEALDLDVVSSAPVPLARSRAATLFGSGKVEAIATPLLRQVAQFGRWLSLAILVVAGATFAIGVLWRGQTMDDMFMAAVALAVAAIPEGLPAIMTIILAIGVQRMATRNAIIRRLPAVETLGSVTVICSDKTGTLTENRMTVTVLDVAGDRIDLTEPLQHGHPAANADVAPEQAALLQQVAEHSGLALLLAGAGLCNDAELEFDQDSRQFRAIGDPTEGALAVSAAQLGLRKDRLAALLPRDAEAPFDSDRKRMTTVHRIVEMDEGEMHPSVEAALRPVREMSGEYVAFTKGAVDSILAACRQVWDGSSPRAMNDDWKDRISAANDELASHGMRVLGVAFRLLPSLPTGGEIEDIEDELIFLGMLGMIVEIACL